MSNSRRWQRLMEWLRSIEESEEHWAVKYDKFYQMLKDKINEIKKGNDHS